MLLSGRVRRTVAVLAVCVGLAGTSLAAKSGARPDPAAAVVAAARQHLGDAYAWGGTGPKAWDCSGLVSTLWRQVGGVADVPRVAQDEQRWAVPIPVEQAQPGDLVFFGDPVTHVGIVTSRTGTTVQMVDASWSRKAVVARTVWTSGVVRFGRVPRPGMPAVQPWTVVAPPPAPAVQAAPASKLAMAVAALAKQAVGRAGIGDADFVRQLWARAGGAVLPTRKADLVSGGTVVQAADVMVGDIVVYGPGVAHVGIYEGDGMMVDASRSLGHVVFRKVWASSALRFVRLAR